MSSRLVVIGVGNRFRRDDGFGPAVLDALADTPPPEVWLYESDGEPTRLLDMWVGADLAVVVETVRRGEAPGSIIELDTEARIETAGDGGAGGSHSLGLADAVALGRVMDRMPRRLYVIGVEPSDLGQGPGLSDAVAAGVNTVVNRVRELVHTGRTTWAEGP
jgi:hydrogenase maturation protease